MPWPVPAGGLYYPCVPGRGSVRPGSHGEAAVISVQLLPGPRVVVTDNTVYENWRNGIALQHVTSLEVRGNLLTDNACSGVSVWQSSDGVVAFNAVSGSTHKYTEWANSNVTFVNLAGGIVHYGFECGINPCFNRAAPGWNPPECACTQGESIWPLWDEEAPPTIIPVPTPYGLGTPGATVTP